MFLYILLGILTLLLLFLYWRSDAGTVQDIQMAETVELSSIISAKEKGNRKTGYVRTRRPYRKILVSVVCLRLKRVFAKARGPPFYHWSSLNLRLERNRTPLVKSLHPGG